MDSDNGSVREETEGSQESSNRSLYRRIGIIGSIAVAGVAVIFLVVWLVARLGGADEVANAKQKKELRKEFEHELLKNYGLEKGMYGMSYGESYWPDVSNPRFGFTYRNKVYWAYKIGDTWYSDFCCDRFVSEIQQKVTEKVNATDCFTGNNGVNVSVTIAEMRTYYDSRVLMPMSITPGDVSRCFDGSGKAEWKKIVVSATIDVFWKDWDERDRFSEKIAAYSGTETLFDRMNLSDAVFPFESVAVQCYVGSAESHNSVPFYDQRYHFDPVTNEEYLYHQDQGRDLYGLEVVLVDWWSDDEWNVPRNHYQEAFWEMQNQAMKNHNYTFKRVANGEWRETWPEEYLAGISENNPMGQIVTFDSRWVASLITTGAFLDVSKLPSVDWSDRKYNQAVLEVMSYNGGIYGFASGMEPRTGVFFNKALFKDAGVSEDFPYELQATGNWDFENFKNLCRKLTRDTNNDGVTDVYGVTGQNTIFFTGLLMANDTFIIELQDGKLVMNAQNRKVLEALNFGNDIIREGYFQPQGDAEWDYFKTGFYEGRAAMFVEESYACDNINAQAPDLDYGFVNIPKGPSAQDYVAICRENILVMPNCERVRTVADDIAFVYDIYTDIPEDYREDDQSWKGNLANRFKDRRSVNETCNWMINKWDQCMSAPDVYISGFSPDWLYDLGNGRAPQETIEAYSVEWQTQVEEFNAKLK